jgi:hypothetical protein
MRFNYIFQTILKQPLIVPTKDAKGYTPNKQQTIASLTKLDQNTQPTYATLSSPQIPQVIEVRNFALEFYINSS